MEKRSRKNDSEWNKSGESVFISKQDWYNSRTNLSMKLIELLIF
jgi:hypothetical protein